jgi:hypothetical protein
VRYAITFPRSAGPDVRTASVLRRASSSLRAVPLGALHDALRQMPGVLLDLDDDHVLALESVGLLVEPEAPRSPVRLLGLEPPRDDEHRWTFAPSFHPPLIVSAFAAGDAWSIHAHWAEISHEKARVVAAVHLEAPPRVVRRAGVGHSTAQLARRALSALLEATHAPEPDPSVAWADGARVALERTVEGTRTTITAHSGEPRATGLASSGLLVASCIDDASLRLLTAEIARYFA